VTDITNDKAKAAISPMARMNVMAKPSYRYRCNAADLAFRRINGNNAGYCGNTFA
jgi:hypothetical protein